MIIALTLGIYLVYIFLIMKSNMNIFIFLLMGALSIFYYKLTYDYFGLPYLLQTFALFFGMLFHKYAFYMHRIYYFLIHFD